MRGSGSSGPSSIGVNPRPRRRPFPETLVGNSLQSALARLREADPTSARNAPGQRVVEQAERMRADLLAVADRLGRGGAGEDRLGNPSFDPDFDLDAGLAQFEQVLAKRDDLDDAGRHREVAGLRDELTTRTLLAGFDAAGERAGLPGMEAFVAGAEETHADVPDPAKEPRQTHVQARLRGRLEDRQRHQEADRIKQAASERKAKADRAAALRSYLLNGEETPGDAREVLNAARADGALDGPALDRLDRILTDRLSFERARDEALSRIDDAIAGAGAALPGDGAASGIVEGDLPWLDCHFEQWLLARNGSNKGLFKKLPYMPLPEDPYRRCRHRLTRWPGLPDIVAYSRAVGETPPMVANRIAAQWESGADREKAQALEIADAIRNETSAEIDAPGLKKALSLVDAGSSPEQVVAHRKSDPRAFLDAGANPAGDPGREAGPEETLAADQGASAEAGAEEGAEKLGTSELIRRQAEADLAPETLPREDLAKRDDEEWDAWGHRIYDALVEATGSDSEEVRKIARRYYGELHKSENAAVLEAANQRVSLEAYLNPPRDQLIDGAELEAFRTWQKENPGADPSDYGLYEGFAAYLGADGNFYRHSDETSKRTGRHAALLQSELAVFKNYASVVLGDYQHVWRAALEGGPSFGRGRTSFRRFGQSNRRPVPAEPRPSNQNPKQDGVAKTASAPEEPDSYQELLKSEVAQKTPGIGFSLIKKGRYKSNIQLIKEWEILNGKKWPMDPETGQRQHVHHIIPLGDGGPDHVSNIEPLTRRAHIKRHKDNGDYSRWASREQYFEEILRRNILPFQPFIDN